MLNVLNKLKKHGQPHSELLPFRIAYIIMKSITVKSSVKKARPSSLRSIKNIKSSPKNSTFRFAPDAAGIMKGPADLSMREGLSK